MKAKFSKAFSAAIAIIIVLASLSSSFALALGREVYTNTLWLADNLAFTNTVTYSDTAGRGESYAIAMTGPGDAYPIVTKGDTIYGTMTLTKIVDYMESLGLNVLAAVNSDFFSTYTGVPMGIVIEDGVYKSSPSDMPAICFGSGGSVSFVESPSIMISLYNNGGGADGDSGADNEGSAVSLRNLNKYRVDSGGMYLYSEHFSTFSTRTSSPGWFVKFKVLDGSLSVSGKMTLEVVSKQMSDGEISIDEGHMVLSAAHAGGYGEEYDKFSVGDTVTLTTACWDEDLVKARYATGGGDILVSNGVKTSSSAWDSALLARAPRTAFGVKKDGTVISYVIDGRNSQHSVGMTMNELADELLRQGCVYGVNFDGGGSSALSVRLPGYAKNAVMNRPSDGAERGCATYIMYVTDAAPDRAPRNLSLRNDGAVVLAGSSIDLAVVATDRGYMPVALPDVVYASSSAAGAAIEGLRYTAGPAAGIDVIELYSPSTDSHGVAFGTGNIFVITQPTSVTVTKKGQQAPLSSIDLAPGETLELGVAAAYHSRPVTAQPLSFDYSISGDIGEMTAPGVFKASRALFKTGTLTVSAGGVRAVIRISVGGFEDMKEHWAKDYVEYLVQSGVSNGVSAVAYGASDAMRQVDYILMLYRAAGEPGFDNYAGEGYLMYEGQDEYYSEALAWAYAVGIVGSEDDSVFVPLAPLERQDAFTFTYRALRLLGIEYEEGSSDDLDGFPDQGEISRYALIPTMTMVKLGVVDGMDGLIQPHGLLTRAQMAKILAVTLQLRV